MNASSDFFNSPPPQQQQDADDVFSQEFDVTRLIVVAQRNIIWIAIIFSLSALGAYFFIRYTKPVYESKSQLKLDLNNEASAVGLSRTESSMEEYSPTSKLSGEIEFIKSPLVLEEVARIPNLKVSYYALGDILFEERFTNNPFVIDYSALEPGLVNQRINIEFEDAETFMYSYLWMGRTIEGTGKVGHNIITEAIVFKLLKTSLIQEVLDGGKYFFTINSIEQIKSYLTQNLSVNIENIEAKVITIGFKDFNRYKASYIVDVIDSIYLIKTVELKTSKHEKTLAFLDTSLSKTQENLLAAENDLENFLKRNKNGDVKPLYDRVYSKLEELEKEKNDINRQVEVLEDLQLAIEKGHDVESYYVALGGIEDPQFVTLLSNYNTLRLDMQRVKQTQSPETYVYKRNQSLLNNTKISLTNQLAQNKLLLQKALFQINTTIFKLEAQMGGLPSKETEMARLKRHYDIYEKFYLLLLDKQTEFEIARAGAIPNFVILSKASLPGNPVFPKPSVIYLFSLGVGLLLSVVLVLLRFILDSSLSSLKEIEQGLNIPLVGGVPEYLKEKMEVSKLVVDNNPKSQISESLRSIRTNLDFISNTRDQKKIISITSTISGEGKTFVAVNLAGILAQSGLKVVLLDMDMRKPKVHLSFGVENVKGMSTILIGKHKVEECVCNTSIENLQFIPSGPTPPNPSELILREEFKQVIDKLHETYDVVFIDSPPVGLVTDGIIIMKHVDIALYVLRLNYSKRSFKSNLRKLVNQSGFTHMGVIVNAVQSVHSYGYGYGYGYGYYDTDSKERTSKYDALKSKLKFNFKK